MNNPASQTDARRREAVRRLLGDLADGQAGGWSLATVAGTRRLDLTFANGPRTATVWLAAAESDTGCYRATQRFRIGHGEGFPPDARALLEAVCARISDAEKGLDAAAVATVLAMPKRVRERPSSELVVVRDTLDLRVTTRCNERCPFCNSSGLSDNRRTDPAAVDRALDEAATRGDTRDVWFTGGEPTLVPDLPRWVRRAREAGFVVGVQTNGLAPGGQAWWDGFRDADGRTWLPDRLFVSFHTQHPDRLKALTGVAGTFPRKVELIRTALDLRLEVVLNFVTSTLNLDELPDFPAFVAATFGAGSLRVDLSVVAPTGRARRRPGLMPPLAALAPAMEAALDASERLGLCLEVPEACGVPACVLPRHARFLQSVRQARPGRPLARDRAKARACSTCIHDPTCVGVWAAWARRFGWAGFPPVRG